MVILFSIGLSVWFAIFFANASAHNRLRSLSNYVLGEGLDRVMVSVRITVIVVQIMGPIVQIVMQAPNLARR